MTKTDTTNNLLAGSAKRLICGLAALGVLGLFANEAAAQQLRFSTTAPGGIVATGNTLGLAKATNENGPGTAHSIGAFIALDPASIDDSPYNAANPWPLGTTSDWTLNGSMAVLKLPAGAQVLHAELVWAGSWAYWPEDVGAYLDDPVALFAGSDALDVSPDPSTALTLEELSYTGFAANYYLRSADVTSFIASHGATAYTVAGVPATQGDNTNSLSGAGWSLVVAYRHEQQPIRNLSVFVGGSFVDEDSQVDYTVSGFCAPPYGVVEGNAVIAALEGDANLTGEDLGVGQTSEGSFVSLSGPNNPENNFFCSQVNGPDGNLDPSGSFGDVNHDPVAGVNVPGARQGWDLTTVALSSDEGHLKNDQTSAVLRTTTVGDSYLPVLVALEIDVKSPDFSDSKTDASMDEVEIGDQFTVTTTLKNSGEAPATELALSLPLESGLELESFSLDGHTGDASGNPVSAAALAQGIDAGMLDVDETRLVELTVTVVGKPDNGSYFVFAPDWGHTFQMCASDPGIDEAFAGPTASVDYLEPQSGGVGGGEPEPPPPPPGDGTPPQADDDPVDPSGCACTAVGSDLPLDSSGSIALLALGAALALRRRRS